MRAVLADSTEETPIIRTFYFQPAKPLRYTAGQFIELTLDHDLPDERGSKRWFTLSSSPTQQLLSITTKYAGDERSSTFKKALFGLQAGDSVDISEPMGDFVLPRDVSVPLVFVAGGIGITPIHSMLQWLADSGENRQLRLMYGVASEEEIIFQETIKKAGVPATLVVSKPSAAWGGERGRLSAEIILGVEAPTPDTLLYLSGPEQMIENLSTALTKHGIKPRQIVTDKFPGYDTST